MSQDFENSYACRPISLAGDVVKLLGGNGGSRVADDDAAAVDKENAAVSPANTPTAHAGAAAAAGGLRASSFAAVHAGRPDGTRDYFGFIVGSKFCTASVNESSLFESPVAATAAAGEGRPSLVTLKSGISAAAFCANCSCVVLGTDTGHLTFATTAGKILFSQKLLPPGGKFSSIVVLPRRGLEDILILAADGTLFMFHQIDFKVIQMLFASKDLVKLAAHRKQMVVSTAASAFPGPHHHVNAAHVVASGTVWVAVCSSKVKDTAIKFWRRESPSGDDAATASPQMVEHATASAQIAEQASHAGIVKIEWTADGKWFMLLGAEGRLSWWTADSCKLVKTLDEFSSVVDFALLETGRTEQGEGGRPILPRVAIQKRRSSGTAVEVLYLDGKKIRKGFFVNSLAPSTRLLASCSMPAGFFTVACNDGDAGATLDFHCYSDPTIRMQQLQNEGGLEAALDVASKFSVNPVGFLEVSLQKLVAQINELDNDTSNCGDAARAELTEQLCAVSDRMDDDYAAVDSLYGAAVGNLGVVRALHAKAAERCTAYQGNPAHSARDKQRFGDMYNRLCNRWRVFERTFCGSLDAAATELASGAPTGARRDVTCTTIPFEAWQRFRTSSVVEVIVRLLNRGMVSQARGIWSFFATECDAAPDIIDILDRFDAPSAFSSRSGEAAFFSDVFTAWMREVLTVVSSDADTLGAVRDWSFATAAAVQAQATVTSSKVALALLSVLDPAQCGAVTNGAALWSAGASTVLGGNTPTRVLQRIHVAKVFREPVSSAILRRAGLSANCKSVGSAEQLHRAIAEAVYLHETHRVSIEPVAAVQGLGASAVALRMLQRAVGAGDVSAQVKEHVRPYLQHHAMDFARVDSGVDRVTNTLDTVLCLYVDSQFTSKAKLEEQLDRLQPHAQPASSSSSSSGSPTPQRRSEADRVDAAEAAREVEAGRAQIHQSLACSMRAIRLVEHLDTKAQRALDFLANLRPVDFSNAVFQFAEDASTWGTAHRAQLLEQRRLLDIYGILAKYGVLSGCSSWAFSVTVPNHARQLLAFITSQIDMGAEALQDALVLVDAYPEFNKLDVFVDFLSSLVSQPLPPDTRAAAAASATPEATAPGPGLGPTTPTTKSRGRSRGGGGSSGSPARRTKLVAQVLKLASEHGGREFRAEVCEELASVCAAMVSTHCDGANVHDQVVAFLTTAGTRAVGVGAAYCRAMVQLSLQVGLLALSQLQSDRRATSAMDSSGAECVFLLSNADVASLRQCFDRCVALVEHFNIIAAPDELRERAGYENSKIADQLMHALQAGSISAVRTYQLAKLLGIPRTQLQASLAELTAQLGRFSEAASVCLNSLDVFEPSMDVDSVSTSATAAGAAAVATGAVQAAGGQAVPGLAEQQLSANETQTLKRIALAMCRYIATHTSAFNEHNVSASGETCSPEFASQLLEKALVGASTADLSDLLQLHRATDIVVQVFAKSTHGDFGKLWAADAGVSGDVRPSSWSRMHFVDSNSVLETAGALHKAVKFAMAAVSMATATTRNGSGAGALSAAPDAAAAAGLKAATHQLVEYLVDNGAEQSALHVLACMQSFPRHGFVLVPDQKMSARGDLCHALFPKMLRSADVDTTLLYGYVVALEDERSRRGFRSKYLKGAVKASLRMYGRLFKLSELGFALSAAQASGRGGADQFQDLGVSAYWWLLLDVRGHVSVDTAAFSKDPKAYLCSTLVGGADGGQLWGCLDFATVIKLADTYSVSRDFVCLRYIEFMLRLPDPRQREAKKHELVGKIVDLLLTPPPHRSQALQSHPDFNAAGLVARTGCMIGSAARGKSAGFADFAGYAAAASGALLPSIDKLTFRLERIRELRDVIARQISGSDFAHLRHVFTVVREAELAVRELVRRCGCDWTADVGAREQQQQQQHLHMGWHVIRILDALIDCRRQAASKASKTRSAAGAEALTALQNVDFHELVADPPSVLLPLTTSETIDILTDSLVWAPIVRGVVSQVQLCDTILQKRFAEEGGDMDERARAGLVHDAICVVEADLRRIGAAAPAACDEAHPARFAVGRCEWVAAQCPTGRLKIKALRVGLDMTALWLQHSQENRLPDQLDAIEKAKALKVQLCHARVVHILSEHVNADTVRAVYEPHLDNPQRLLCLLYHNMAPKTLAQQQQLDATGARTAAEDNYTASTVHMVDVHGIVDEIAACYGPSVRLGPLIQHLIKHWLKNGPVAPVKRQHGSTSSQHAHQHPSAHHRQQQHQQQQLQHVFEADAEGDTTEESAMTFSPSLIDGRDSSLPSKDMSLESPATTCSLSTGGGGSTDGNGGDAAEGSPSPFNFHKVLSSKPGSRMTRLSYSASPADGPGSSPDSFDRAFDTGRPAANANVAEGGLLEPTPEELQEVQHLEVVAKITFVIQAPFGGATWTPQRRAEFLLEYAFRAHPQSAARRADGNHGDGGGAAAGAAARTKPSYEGSAAALHALFYITDDPGTLEAATKAQGSSLDQVMMFWQQCMYMRVFDRLQLPYNVDRLANMRTNPLGFVRGLWRDYRHQGAMLPLIGRMMLDFSLRDEMLWAALLQQMHKLKMFRRLVLLLHGIAAPNALLRASPQIRAVWAATVRRAVQHLHMEAATGGFVLPAATTAGFAEMTGVSRQTRQTSLILQHVVGLAERSVEYVVGSGAGNQAAATPAVVAATAAAGGGASAPAPALVGADDVATLARVCCRLCDWDLAFRCCAVAAAGCGGGDGAAAGFSTDQLSALVRDVLRRIRDNGSSAATINSAGVPADASFFAGGQSQSAPLGQFVRHLPTHRVGPTTARLLAAVFTAVEADGQAANAGDSSAATAAAPSLVQQLANLPRHWAEYQKFVAAQTARGAGTD